jgi:glycosyltransferase involved in cell wall biosynthesis
LNEEFNIVDAIKSVSFADEIIVIDSFSEDKTIALAKKHKVRVIQREFDDFSSQKNHAIQQAKHNWIYILDADERVNDALRVEIFDAIQNPDNKVGFYIYRAFYFFDRRINYGGWQRDKVIRLFRKDKCKYDGKLVHELIEYDGEVGFLKNKIEHYSYQNYDYYSSKLDQYTSLQAEDLFNKKRKVNAYHLTVKPIYRFISHYILRFGFLDGFPGFVLANHHAYGVFTRYVKLWLLNKNNRLNK